jgi:hypothetical protein
LDLVEAVAGASTKPLDDSVPLVPSLKLTQHSRVNASTQSWTFIWSLRRYTLNTLELPILEATLIYKNLKEHLEKK